MRQVRKVRTTKQAQPKLKPTSPEALIKYNGELIEQLFSSDAWKEIAFPLLEESIASVSGRFTNGRFYQGSLTRTKQNRDELSGYQLALEEYYNRLTDFITEKEKLKEKKKTEQLDRVAPMYNPFLEEMDYEREKH